MFFVVRKKSLVLCISAILIICLIAVVIANDSVVTAFSSNKELPIYEVETEQNVVALSFDAAWGADKTREIMNILEKYGVKGNFFLVGFWIDEYPDLVKEIATRGHLIGNHSENHKHMNDLSKNDKNKEISSVNQKIKNLTGITPTYFRAPYGEYNNALIKEVTALNMQAIQWSIDSLDWKGLSGGEIATRIVNRVKNGSIILCHNNSDHILEALPLILTALENKNLKAVRLDEFVYQDNYTIDHTGKQIKSI